MLIIPRGADESFLTLAALMLKGVQLHVCLELIGVLKNLFTLHTFGLSLCDFFVDSLGAQKPPVLLASRFRSPYIFSLLLSCFFGFRLVFWCRISSPVRLALFFYLLTI